MGKLINISGRLHSREAGETPSVVTGANEVYDDDKHLRQSEINANVDEAVTSLQTAVDTKQQTITKVNVDVNNEVGQPSGTASVEGGTMNLSLKNIKGNKGDTGNGIADITEEVSSQDGEDNVIKIQMTDGTRKTVTVKNGRTGKQGATSVYDSTTQNFLTTLETDTGQSETKTMTQKAITDALIAKWVPMPYKFINNIALSSGVSVGDTGVYETKNSSYKYKLVYLEVNAGDIIRINFSELAGNIHGYFSSVIPAAGVTATHIYSKNYENTETPFEFSLAMTASGYLGIATKIETNSNMPLLYKAILASDDKSKLIATEKIDIEDVDEIGYSLTSVKTWLLANNVKGKIIEITPLKKYVLSSSLDATFGLLKTNNVATGATANLSDVYSSRLIVPAGSEVFITAPDDAHYIYLQTVDSNGDATNVAISEADSIESVVTKTKETLSDVCDVMEDGLHGARKLTLVPYKNIISGKNLSASTGNIVDGSQNSLIKYYDLDPTKTYCVTCRNPMPTNYCGLYFYDINGDGIGPMYRGDGSTSAFDVVKELITPPEGAASVRVFGNLTTNEPILYEASGSIVLQDLYDYMSEIKSEIPKEAFVKLSALQEDSSKIGYYMNTSGQYKISSGDNAIIKIYNNIDVSKEYRVTCRQYSTNTAASVCLFDENGDIISAQYVGDGTPAHDVVKGSLDILPNTKTIKVCSNVLTTQPMLYVVDGAINISDLNLDVESIKRHPLNGKKIAVLGDSISTIFGNNNPYFEIKECDVDQEIQSYVSWNDIYPNNNDTDEVTGKTIGDVLLTTAMVDGELHTFTPNASDVGKKLYVPRHYSGNDSDVLVWSQVLCQLTGAELIANASFSGSSINSSETIGRGQQFEGSHAWHPCTIGRCKTRDENGNDILPDVIIIMRGVNDFSYTNGTHEGTPYPSLSIEFPNMLDGFRYNTDKISEGQYNFVVGYILTIQRLREAYPNATIVCGIPPIVKRRDHDVFPSRNDAFTLPDIFNCIRKIANYMGCDLIELDKCGITWENCYPTYIEDSLYTPTHPNNKGHRVMGEKAAADLKYVLNP